jgi:hypothetical protein
MRRLVLSLLAASSLALLTACGQGGTAFGGGSSGNANNVILTTGQGTTGVFTVRAGFPIVVSATATAGTENVVTTNQNFTFTWAFAPTGTLYNNGSVSGATQSPCAAPPAGYPVPPATILSNAGQNFVTVTPPGTVAGYGAGTTLGGSATAGAPYCVIVFATHANDGVVGKQVILVTT